MAIKILSGGLKTTPKTSNIKVVSGGLKQPTIGVKEELQPQEPQFKQADLENKFLPQLTTGLAEILPFAGRVKLPVPVKEMPQPKSIVAKVGRGAGSLLGMLPSLSVGGIGGGIAAKTAMPFLGKIVPSLAKIGSSAIGGAVTLTGAKALRNVAQNKPITEDVAKEIIPGAALGPIGLIRNPIVGAGLSAGTMAAMAPKGEKIPAAILGAAMPLVMHRPIRSGIIDVKGRVVEEPTVRTEPTGIPTQTIPRERALEPFSGKINQEPIAGQPIGGGMAPQPQGEGMGSESGRLERASGRLGYPRITERIEEVAKKNPLQFYEYNPSTKKYDILKIPKKVTIYRFGRSLKAGDFVGLKEGIANFYATQIEGGGKIIKKKVPIEDIVISPSGGLEEFIYQPKLSQPQGEGVIPTIVKDALDRVEMKVQSIPRSMHNLPPEMSGKKVAHTNLIGIPVGEQGKGYGRQLMKALEDKAISQGADFIALTQVLPEVRGFYNKLGYTIDKYDLAYKKLSQPQGEGVTLYHGTDAEFETFDLNKSKAFGKSKFGHWFTEKKQFAEMFGKNIKEATVDLKNPKVISKEKWDEIRSEHAKDGEWFKSWKNKLILEGYDGLKVEGKKEMFAGQEVESPPIVAVFTDKQIKLSQPQGEGEFESELNKAMKQPYEMTQKEFGEIPIIKYIREQLADKTNPMTVSERNQLAKQLVDSGIMSIDAFNAMTGQHGFGGVVGLKNLTTGKPIPSKPIDLENDMGARINYIGQWQTFRVNADDFAHRNQIVKALEEGKTVPKDVLAEYVGWTSGTGEENQTEWAADALRKLYPGKETENLISVSEKLLAEEYNLFEKSHWIKGAKKLVIDEKGASNYKEFEETINKLSSSKDDFERSFGRQMKEFAEKYDLTMSDYYDIVIGKQKPPKEIANLQNKVAILQKQKSDILSQPQGKGVRVRQAVNGEWMAIDKNGDVQGWYKTKTEALQHKISPIKETKEISKLDDVVDIYRGETSASENRGKGGIGYYSLDEGFATEFTQTGQKKELIRKKINTNLIYDASREGKELPSATNEKDFDDAMAIAKEKGYYGFRLTEGKGQPDSIYIFDKKAFTSKLSQPQGEGVSEIKASIDSKGNFTMPGDTLTQKLSLMKDTEIIDLMRWARIQSAHIKRNVEQTASAELRSRGVPVDEIEWQISKLSQPQGEGVELNIGNKVKYTNDLGKTRNLYIIGKRGDSIQLSSNPKSETGIWVNKKELEPKLSQPQGEGQKPPAPPKPTAVGQPEPEEQPLSKDEIYDEAMQELNKGDRDIIQMHIVEDKSLEQIAQETGEDIEDLNKTLKYAIADYRKIDDRIREQYAKEETSIENEQKKELRLFLKGKLKPGLKLRGEYSSLKMIPWLWAKEGEGGYTPDELTELNEMGYPIENGQDVIDLIKTWFADEIKRGAEKAESQERIRFSGKIKKQIEQIQKSKPSRAGKIKFKRIITKGNTQKPSRFTQEEYDRLRKLATEKGLIYKREQSGKERNRLQTIEKYFSTSSAQQIEEYIKQLTGQPGNPPLLFKMFGDIEKNTEVMKILKDVSSKWEDILPIEIHTLDPVRIVEAVTKMDATGNAQMRNILADNTFLVWASADDEYFKALTRELSHLDKAREGIKKGSKESADLMEKAEKGKPLTEKEQRVARYLRTRWDEILEINNQMRVANGYKPIPYRRNYWTHINEFNLLHEFFKQNPNAAHNVDFEQLDAIRNSDYTKGNMPFNRFAKQRKGKKTKYDAIGNFETYVRTMLKERYYTPAIKHSRKFIKYALIQQPNAYIALDRKLNTLKGKSMDKQNMFETALGNRFVQWANARISANYLVANINFWLTNASNFTVSFDELGPYMTKGMNKFLGNKEMRHFAFTHSIMLRNRTIDPEIDPSTFNTAKEAASYITNLLEYNNVGSTWVGAYLKATEELLYPQDRAIQYADAIARRTQAGYKKYETNNYMDTNFGKVLSKFQNWSFNMMNHLLYDLGAKNIPLNIIRKFTGKEQPKVRWGVMFTLIVTSMLVNMMYRKLGMRPPYEPRGFVPGIPFLTRSRYEEPPVVGVGRNAIGIFTAKKPETRYKHGMKVATAIALPFGGAQVGRLLEGNILPQQKEEKETTKTNRFNRRFTGRTFKRKFNRFDK